MATVPIDFAQHIDPERLSAERRARYYIDLAQAHAMRRQIGEALALLEKADQLTPEQTRIYRVARAAAGDLIQLSGSRPHILASGATVRTVACPVRSPPGTGCAEPAPQPPGHHSSPPRSSSSGGYPAGARS